MYASQYYEIELEANYRIDMGSVIITITDNLDQTDEAIGVSDFSLTTYIYGDPGIIVEVICHEKCSTCNGVGEDQCTSCNNDMVLESG